MQLKNLVPLLKPAGHLPRAYFLYGNEDEILLATAILKSFLQLRFPKLKVSSLSSLCQLPVPDLFGGGGAEPFLYSIKKSTEDLDFLGHNNRDMFIFPSNKLAQKSPFLQKNRTSSEVVFLACYEASFRDFNALLSLIDATFEPEALEFLEVHFRLFPGSVISLLDKLPFLPERVTKHMIQRLLPEEEESSYHLLVDAFFSPSSTFKERMRVTSFQDTDFIPFSRVFMNACQKLHQLLLSIQGGSPLKTALFSLRYPPFFDKQAFFSQSLNRQGWDILSQLYEAFLDFEKALMKGDFQASSVMNALYETHEKLFSGNTDSKNIK